MAEEWVELELDDKPQVEVVETTKEKVPEESKASPEVDEAAGIENPKINKRITSLVSRRKEAEARATEAEARAAALEAKLSEATKTAITTQTQNVDIYGKSLEDNLSLAKKAFRDAYDKGDGEALAEAQEKISELKVQMVNLVNYKQQLTTQKVEEPKVEKERTPSMPEATKDWMSENRWFNKDQKLTRRALLINSELLEEDFDPDSSEFYEELDKRLKTFGVKKDDEEVEVEEPKARSKSPVSSNSRESGGSKKIRLSQDDVAVARKMGISLEEMARQKMKIDKSSKAGEAYTPVFE